MKDIQISDRTSLKIWIVVGAVIGGAVFFVSCGLRILNPFNYDWILKGYHDCALSFWGWIFYEKTPIAESLFSTNSLTYPHECSIIFTDAISPFAIILRPICRLFLKKGTIIQYIGWWSFFSFILQGMASSIILKKMVNSNIVRIVGIIVICLSPCLFLRLFFHNTLTAHYLVLLSIALYLYSNELDKKKYILWVVLFGFASMIHIYFVPICGIILLADAVRDYIKKNNIAILIGTLISCIAISVAMVAMLGGFSQEISSPDPAWSYTVLYKYSCNLLTGIIPRNYSFFLPELPSIEEEIDGYAYIGVGMMIASMLAFIVLIIAKRKGYKFFTDKVSVYCLMTFAIMSLIISIGPRISILDRELAYIHTPYFIDKIFATFRSIGRFIWFPFYTYIICILTVLDKKGRILFRKDLYFSAFIIGVLLIQIIDLSPMISYRRNTLEEDSHWESTMKSSRWDSIANQFDYIYIITAKKTSYPSDEAYSMYMYAYENDLKTTSTYFAHMNDTLMNDSIEYYQDLINGKAREKTLYWFENEEYYENASQYIHCEMIDGYYVGWLE